MPPANLALILLHLARSFLCDESQPALDISAAVDSTRKLAEEVTQDGTLPGLSIALVDGSRVVWAQGFGLADLERKVPATPATLYRVGSISKLFTALAAMQLVESGKLSLDRPLDEYGLDLQVINPFLAEAGPVTPRHMFSHASGFFREPPLGSYFDSMSPGSPSRVINSVRGLRLVHPPGKVTKYSNAAVSILGSVVERLAGVPYEDHLQRSLLEPLGMRSSGYRRASAGADRVAIGYMQERDRRLTRAPTFELSTIAAGNLYSSVEDLAKLALFLHGRGKVEERQLLRPDTLEEMWRRQFPQAGGRYGIGFAIGERSGERLVEHSGAVYGFSSVFACLPDARLSIILLANEDVAFGPLRRLSDRLLGGALALRQKKPLPVEISARAVDLATFGQATGVYRSEKGRLELRTTGSDALLVWQGHSVRLLETAKDSFLARDRLMDGNLLVLERSEGGRVGSVRLDGVRYDRFMPVTGAEAPAAWSGLEGEYGPEYLPVRIKVREGRLVAECETFEYEPLPRDDGTFVFPRGTLYEDEVLRFERGPNGRASALTLGTMHFERLPLQARK